jgi:cytochrome c oxidase accessory protein FixG
MTTSRRFRPWRRAAEWSQAAVLLGLPFLRVGGESALRFDVPSLRLHLFGASLALDEMFLVLAATLFATFAFLLATLLLGRVWCGWACPQTALSDLTATFDRWRRRGGSRAVAAWVALAAVSAAVAADLVWYFVEPREFLRGLLDGTLHPVALGTWAVAGLTILLDLALVRARFCATVCPYAKLQGVLFDRHTLVVAYDERRAADCVDCGACVRVCPTSIDIRRGLQTECIACAECADACGPIMAKLRRQPSLVGYSFGAPGAPRRLLRPAVLAAGALAGASAALLVTSAAARTVLELDVQAATDFAPRRTTAGQVVNAFRVSLENRGRAPVAVKLALRAGGASAVRLRPDEVQLGAGESRSLRILALADGAGPGPIAGELVAAPASGRGIARAVILQVPPAERRPEGTP